MAAGNKSPAFYEVSSWFHRIKILQPDGSTKYSKRGGFATREEAEKSYYKCEEEYTNAYRAYYVCSHKDFAFKEYLQNLQIPWTVNRFRQKEFQFLFT